MTKEYVHTKKAIEIGQIEYIMGHIGRAIPYRIVIDRFEEQLVPYQGINILVLSQWDRINGSPRYITIVPGSVVDYKSKFIGDKKDLPVSVVEPIIDENKKKELSDLLVSQGFQRPIYFWYA